MGFAVKNVPIFINPPTKTDPLFDIRIPNVRTLLIERLKRSDTNGLVVPMCFIHNTHLNSGNFASKMKPCLGFWFLKGSPQIDDNVYGKS